MAINTYEALRTTTLTSGAATVTLDLTGLSSYTDLRIVVNAANNDTAPDWSPFSLYFNGDNTSGLYSDTVMYYTGAGNSGVKHTNQNYIRLYSIVWNTIQYANIMTLDILNYKSSKHKTVLYKGGLGQTSGSAPWNSSGVGLWRSTSAITSVSFNTTSFRTGSTFTVYGIKAASSSSPKATGGTIYEDDTYWYHAFGASANFIPNQTLTCDFLVVAGGGGGGAGGGGGGGAGGFRTSVGTSGGGGSAESPLSLSAGTYAVTIGGGGAGGTQSYPSSTTRGSTGTNTTISSITSAGGGGAGSLITVRSGLSGGSGGGVSSESTIGSELGGAGTSNQGYAGGSRVSGGKATGGGGAGGVGGNTPDSGNGGPGVLAAINNTYYAGGGGGGWQTIDSSNYGGLGGIGGGGSANSGNGTPGVINTGSGGAGGNYQTGSNGWNNGSAGGSGLVIIRYVK